MDQRRQAVALFRYSLIRELAVPELTPRQRGALVRALAATDHAGPDGRRVAVSAVTLRRWLRGASRPSPRKGSPTPAQPDAGDTGRCAGGGVSVDMGHRASDEPRPARVRAAAGDPPPMSRAMADIKLRPLTCF